MSKLQEIDQEFNKSRINSEGIRRILNDRLIRMHLEKIYTQNKSGNE